MCNTCANAFRKYFPHLTTKQQIDLLWCGTAYPAVVGEEVEKQVKDLALQSGGEYETAMDLAHEDVDKAMANRISP